MATEQVSKALTTAEELRQLIREAHEARSDLERARKKTMGDVHALSVQVMDAYSDMLKRKFQADVTRLVAECTKVRDSVHREAEGVQETFHEFSGAITLAVARVAGMATGQDLIEMITETVLAELHRQMADGLVDIVDGMVQRELSIRRKPQNRGRGKRR